MVSGGQSSEPSEDAMSELASDVIVVGCSARTLDDSSTEVDVASSEEGGALNEEGVVSSEEGAGSEVGSSSSPDVSSGSGMPSGATRFAEGVPSSLPSRATSSTPCVTSFTS